MRKRFLGGGHSECTRSREGEEEDGVHDELIVKGDLLEIARTNRATSRAHQKNTIKYGHLDASSRNSNQPNFLHAVIMSGQTPVFVMSE